MKGEARYNRVLRGGCFNNNNRNVRCANRNRNNPDNRNNNIGFRIVLSTFFICWNCQTLRVSGCLSEAKNGGAYSRPHLVYQDRANSNYPDPWDLPWVRGLK
ncbi:MAG: SUMF1/EgtB/PvdO family nonheme iron enzyme [Candidatus Brocadiales bacterium]|nr:SUMF1/EgtB/PvdO family nonheme iron enzyme [Candidatus Brocadiales bacterium]